MKTLWATQALPREPPKLHDEMKLGKPRGKEAASPKKRECKSQAKIGRIVMVERRTIEIHIVMDESGAFVVDEDPNEAAERAERELGEDADVRQVAISVEMLPPSQSSEPIKITCKID